jgi:hypothetical protein
MRAPVGGVDIATIQVTHPNPNPHPHPNPTPTPNPNPNQVKNQVTTFAPYQCRFTAGPA